MVVNTQEVNTQPTTHVFRDTYNCTFSPFLSYVRMRPSIEFEQNDGRKLLHLVTCSKILLFCYCVDSLCYICCCDGVYQIVYKRKYIYVIVV